AALIYAHSLIARPVVHTTDRNSIRPEEPPTPAQIHWTAAIDSGNVKFSVDQPYIMRGVPVEITLQQGSDPPRPCTTVVAESLNSFTLGFGVTVGSGDILTVPDFVDEVRSQSAGWLDPGVVTLSSGG